MNNCILKNIPSKVLFTRQLEDIANQIKHKAILRELATILLRMKTNMTDMTLIFQNLPHA